MTLALHETGFMTTLLFVAVAALISSFVYLGVPMLMLHKGWWAVSIIVLYVLNAIFGYLEHAATVPYVFLTIVSCLLGVVSSNFVLHNVSPGEFLLKPVLLFSLGLAIAFYVTDQKLGCSAPAAYSASISYVAGNILWWGYVFLAIVLTMLPLLLINKLEQMKVENTKVLVQAKAKPSADIKPGSGEWTVMQQDEKKVRTSEWLVRIGFCLSSMTGVFPWLAKRAVCRNVNSLFNLIFFPSCSDAADVFHMGGFLSGIAFSLVGATWRAYQSLSPNLDTLYKVMPGNFAGCLPNHRYTLLNFSINLIFVLAILTVCHFLQFGILFSIRPERSIWTVCTLYASEAECHGARVPKSEMAYLESNGGWPCVWNETATDEDAFNSLSRCTDPSCYEDDILQKFSASILCEYLMICNWLFIVSLCLLLVTSVEQRDIFVQDAQPEGTPKDEEQSTRSLLAAN